MADSKSKRRASKQKLLDDNVDDGGISNPSLDNEMEVAYQAFSHTEGESSTAELIEENEQAEVLKGELKSRHRRRRRELSKLVSPKDDLTGELKTVKLDSRKKIDETEQEEDLAQALAEAGAAVQEDEARIPEAGDGVVPVPKEKKPEVEEPSEEKPVSPPPAPAEQKEEQKSEVEKAEAEETKIKKPEPEAPKPEEPKPAPEKKRSTIRERMKNRLAKAKEEAESEFEKQERDERKKILKGKKETRFVEMDEEEVARLEARTEQIRKQRRDRAKQHEALSFMPTQEEAFDFFTREWEPEPETQETEAKKEEEEEEEPKPEQAEGEEEETEEERAAKEEDKKEEDKLLMDDDDYTPEGYGPVAIRKATMFDPEVISKAEQEMLFFPSSTATPASEKVTGDLEPRFLEDEGFYVGVKPAIATKNMSKMENRLLKETEKSEQPSKWFGEDGQMIVLPDPLRATPVRPPLLEEDAPYLDVVFQKAIMREFDSRYIDGTVEGGGFYQLDVDINSISFTHHHLFSREHVLAYKLSSLYEEYLARDKRNMTEFLIEKLMALKRSAVLLHDYILAHKGEMSVADRDNYERRLRDYKSEIRLTRAMRDQEEQTDRTVLKAIINTWKEMKALREQQNYVNTPLKLQLRKEETNKSEDLIRWKQEMEEEIKEEKEYHEEEFMRKETVYKAALEKYEKQQKEKDEAAKRIAERTHQRRGSKSSKVSKNSQETPRSDQAKNEDNEDDGLDEDNERDQEILDEEPLDKPEPPESFDEQAVKERVKAKALAQKRRPGEPKLFPEVTSTATVTPSNQCSRGEQQRRDDVSKCKVYVKILFNGKEVSRSGQRPLSQDFKVNFGQIYNLKIVEWPESLKYEIYESMGFGSGRMLAEIFAPIPESSVTSQSVTLENIEFSSFEKIQFSHEGVGSGFAFKFEGHVPDLVTLMTTGIFNSSVAWAVDEEGVPLVPTDRFGAGYQAATQLKRLDPFAAIGASGVANMEKLLKWFKDSRLDPNDPNNKDLVYMLSGNDQTLLQPREYFRLEPLQQEFDFITTEDLDGNPRFRMISLRNEEHSLFKGYQMIPIHDKELPRDIFKMYKQKVKEKTTLPQVKGDLDQHRAQVNQYLQQIKDRVMTQYKFASHQKALQDMVNEDTVPNISMLATSLLRLSEPRRPLKPIRKERKKVTAQALDGKEVKILINIIRASYIPVRKNLSGQMGGRDETRPEKSDSYSELVCPYFEVMFQRSHVRTRRGEGPNPSFNEELELTLKVPNDDYTPSALQTIEDVIYLNLFDEVTVDVLKDNRERETNVHQRIEKKWLGSINIPFSTIYFNNKIDGTFKINTPPFLLGYTQDVSQMQPGMSEVESSINKGQGNTYVSMFVTVEPSLTLPEPFKEKLASNEEEDLLHYAEVWQAKLESKFPKRIFKTTVMDTSGKNVFVTRYFRSLKPPPEVEACTEPAKAMELAARYVSLIPFVADTTLFPGQCDIWSTSNQFMRMLCGDEEEHAVLLTNFFLGMGKNAWLLLGNAVPEGETAYVLTEENGLYSLWNARSGEKFRVEDNYCPIQIAGCLINGENIWANIQQYEKPTQMDFNITNTSKWQPFYTRSFLSRGLASIQPAQLSYKRKDKKFNSLIVELQERIEQMLKNKIMEWRTRYITRWNRHCTQIMRKLLPQLEKNCGKPIDQSNLKDLEDSFKSYKVSGFPLNMQYSDLNAITEAVFSTGVHAQETSDVEFALAVHVEGYTNNVMSIWIYVASLVRLR